MFFPPALFTFSKLSLTVGPALLVAVSKYGNSFLVAGGDDPSAIMLDGRHAGHFIKVSQGEHFEGMAIAGIEIEVEDSSAYIVRGLNRPLLSVVRHANGLGIFAQNENSFGGRHLPCIVWEGASFVAGEDAIGFTSWNAFIRVGDNKHILHQHRGESIRRD